MHTDPEVKYTIVAQVTVLASRLSRADQQLSKIILEAQDVKWFTCYLHFYVGKYEPTDQKKSN